MKPKVFVGTLHSNEGDFSRCLEALQKQDGIEITHHVVSGRNELDAHNTLWSEWNKAKLTHDIFVKVDADIVLTSNTVLHDIARCFIANPTATGLQAPLHDYMTDSLIHGLNAYTSKVEFTVSVDSLYCDRAMTIGNDQIIRQPYLPNSLIPAGFHCHHASTLQAFRYGLHRVLKGQDDIVQQMIDVWRVKHDRIRGLGVLGAQAAAHIVNVHTSDYTDAQFLAEFFRAEKYYDEHFRG